ncbi:hypothetical protein MCAP1_003313 [Malassezia caprae]|uniref:BZIP domain-containing protein n=1 Tax=Malassezia caprae TaxID=1381934 RepID=A0AAF0E788_9BASI|nr:hypothetical protein MCAP1_003313 [Malassezia caprae]
MESTQRGAFSPLGTAAALRAAEPGSSEFDAFIHSDLCAGSSGAQDSAAPPFGFVPFSAPVGKQEDNLPLWSHPSSAGLIGADPAPALRVSDPTFPSPPLWPAAHAPVNASDFRAIEAGAKPDAETGHAALAQLMGDAALPSTSAWLPSGSANRHGRRSGSLSSAGSTPAMLPSDEAASKRARLSESPERKPRSVSAQVPGAGAPDAVPGRAAPPRRAASTGSRRPPPSASQVTEAGLPFPVIDTSAKHSSLFVPPDTSGLTKREARLVKNRAAAFLSRQRKREQFEELACKCRALARLSWLLWSSLEHATEASPMAVLTQHGLERVLSATPLGEQLQYESDELRSTLQQVVSQQGTMVVESIMGDDVPIKAKPHDVSAQLAAAQKECERLRAELARARAAPAPPGARDESLTLVHTVGEMMIRMAHAPADKEAALREEAMQMRVHVAPGSESVLCTVLSEPAAPGPAAADDLDDKSWRCSTPADSSEASMPSLCSSASPTLSSLSSGSGAARRQRRVVAYCAGTERSPSLLDRLRPVCLDEWAAAHAAQLHSTGEAPEASAALQSLLAQRGVDAHDGCFLVGAHESDGPKAPTKLALYAKGAENTPLTPPSCPPPLVACVRETLRALGEEGPSL